MTDRELLAEIATHLNRWSETDRPLDARMWREAMAGLATLIRGQLESAPMPGPATAAMLTAARKSRAENHGLSSYLTPDMVAAFLAEHEPAP